MLKEQLPSQPLAPADARHSALRFCLKILGTLLPKRVNKDKKVLVPGLQVTKR
jgi:hypothetical protein